MKPSIIKAASNWWKEHRMVRKVDKILKEKPEKHIEYHYRESNGYRGAL